MLSPSSWAILRTTDDLASRRQARSGSPTLPRVPAAHTSWSDDSLGTKRRPRVTSSTAGSWEPRDPCRTPCADRDVPTRDHEPDAADQRLHELPRGLGAYGWNDDPDTDEILARLL